MRVPDAEDEPLLALPEPVGHHSHDTGPAGRLEGSSEKLESKDKRPSSNPCFIRGSWKSLVVKMWLCLLIYYELFVPAFGFLVSSLLER